MNWGDSDYILKKRGFSLNFALALWLPWQLVYLTKPMAQVLPSDKKWCNYIFYLVPPLADTSVRRTPLNNTSVQSKIDHFYSFWPPYSWLN
jgi:hypothetical protein